MARVENTVRGARELNALTPAKDGRKHFPIPGAVSSEGVLTNGSGEVPDGVLDELLAKDACTQGWFKSGELIDMRKAPSAPAAAEGKADSKPENKAKAAKGE